MQASLESEQRAKAEALRIKKKLEGDINELEIALDHANKANSEAQKAIKRYQGQHREAECAYEEEQRQRQEVVERATLADRRANALAGEMEEARSLLDSAERGNPRRPSCQCSCRRDGGGSLPARLCREGQAPDRGRALRVALRRQRDDLDQLQGRQRQEGRRERRAHHAR